MRDCFLFADSSEEEGSDDEMIADKDSDVSGVRPDLHWFAWSRNGVTDKGSNISFLFPPLQENWDEDDEKEEQSDEQDMTVEKEINGDSDLEPENESEEE